MFGNKNVKIKLLFSITQILSVYSQGVLPEQKSEDKQKSEDNKIGKYQILFYFSANVLDFLNNYDRFFLFSRLKLNNNTEFYKRVDVGLENSFNVKNLFFYNLSLSFGLGSYCLQKNRAAMFFFEVIPFGMLFKIKDNVYSGCQIGFDVILNYKNMCRDIFFLSYKNIFLKANIIRLKSKVSFTFSKEIKIFDILDKRLYKFFFNGWEVKVSI